MQAPVASSGSVSLLTPIGYQSSSCGYCKDPSSRQRTPESRASYYAQAKSLTVEHYQELIDRGWRRSGSLLYKEDVRRSCCPHYTIRLPAASFTPAKDQRQAMNRWNRFVLGDDYIKQAAKLYPKSKEQKARDRNVFDLHEAVHESENGFVKLPPEPAHRFEVDLEPDNFTEEKFKLFENYQRNVHHEGPSDISRNGFKRFLCDSPLPRTTRVVEGKDQQFGSYHQCYRLDGQLIAIGVLDLLPHCVSGVYFMYHESVAQWSFGKLSALREAQLAVEGGYTFYYMGFYIHSCIKMRYKGDYKPQQVLDPESLEWNPLEGRMRALLDVQKYVSLSREAKEPRNATSNDTVNPPDLDEHVETQDKSRGLESAKDAADAVRNGLSLFNIDMPGVMTADEITDSVDIGAMKLMLRKQAAQMRDIVSFESGSIEDSRSLKGLVAELAACVGPIVASGVFVSLG